MMVATVSSTKNRNAINIMANNLSNSLENSIRTEVRTK